MTRMLQRVFVFGILSHVLAFSTLFVMASSLFHGGSTSVAVFFPTGLLLALVMVLDVRRGGEQGGWLWLQIVIVLAGVGSMLWVDTDQRLILMGIFVGMQILLLRRMFHMVEDLSYVRRLLYEQFQTDFRLLVLFGIAATFLPTFPDWQYTALPFLTAFVLMRMLALSTASQMTKHVEERPEQATWAEKWQGKAPLLLIGCTALGGWLLSVMGVPVLTVIEWVLTPLLYLIGWIVQLVIESGVLTSLANMLQAVAQFLSDIFAWILCKIFGLCEMDDSLLPIQEEEPFLIDEGGSPDWTILVGILATLLIGYTLFRMFRNRRTGMFQTADGIVEIREFILEDASGDAGGRFLSGLSTRTRMRKIYRKFLLTMKKQGYLRGEGETALEYIRKIAVERPEKQASMQELTDYYMQERYGGKQVDDRLSRSEKLAQDLYKKSKK